MTLEIPQDLLAEIQTHGEAAYPEEGAGLLEMLLGFPVGAIGAHARLELGPLPAQGRQPLNVERTLRQFAFDGIEAPGNPVKPVPHRGHTQETPTETVGGVR